MIDPKTGTGRALLRTQDLEAFQPGGSLVLDDRRRRPFYFDGRFLAARDLIREQNYFLTRQADIARAAGFGRRSCRPLLPEHPALGTDSVPSVEFIGNAVAGV